MLMLQPSIYINEGIYCITDTKYQFKFFMIAFLIPHYLELSQHIWGIIINI